MFRYVGFSPNKQTGRIREAVKGFSRPTGWLSAGEWLNANLAYLRKNMMQMINRILRWLMQPKSVENLFLFWVWTHVTQSNSSSQEDNSNDGLIPLRFMDCIRSLRKENEMLVLMV
ncbi:hypothetical protein JHK87_040609 [Glycine soja]|nr:hypothetical protein JHK87_040609 [Glycine soja]